MREQTIPRVLQRAMRDTGATQADLAKLFGVSQPLISRWLAGKRRPRDRRHLRRLLNMGADPRSL